MQKILTPEDVTAAASNETPPLRLPDTEVFAARAHRLNQLADGHAMADFLRFCVVLATAQQNALKAFDPAPVPAEQKARCREHGMPPLDAQGTRADRLDPAWTLILRTLIDSLAAAPDLPPPLAAALAGLRDQLAADRTDDLASTLEALLARPDEAPPGDLAAAPLLAATLQVLWARQAQRLSVDDFVIASESPLCPVCGAHPVASVLRPNASGNAVRYAVCGLCASEWHVTRIKCVPCQSTEGISYHGLEGPDGARHPAVQVETCERCHASLKIVSQAKDVAVDPFADDLATLTLDLLADEAGYHRAGRNLFFFSP